METTKIVLFKGKKIRKEICENEWWFSVVDIVEALTDSVEPRKYWHAMKIRVKNDEGFELSTICRQLKLVSSDEKKYETDCANTEGVFRIIQSVPSPKAEPFKRWLKSDMKEYRKLKIPNSQPKGPGCCINLRVIPRIGLKNACEALQSGRS